MNKIDNIIDLLKISPERRHYKHLHSYLQDAIIDILHEYTDDLYTFEKIFYRVVVEDCDVGYLLNILIKARDLKQPKQPC